MAHIRGRGISDFGYGLFWSSAAGAVRAVAITQEGEIYFSDSDTPLDFSNNFGEIDMPDAITEIAVSNSTGEVRASGITGKVKG